MLDIRVIVKMMESLFPIFASITNDLLKLTFLVKQHHSLIILQIFILFLNYRLLRYSKQKMCKYEYPRERREGTKKLHVSLGPKNDQGFSISLLTL